MKKDIFISYRNDGIGNNFATRIASDLKQQGYSVYFNPDEDKAYLCFKHAAENGAPEARVLLKSGLIEFTNQIIHDLRPLICFSRPRRFGKSIAAHMLAAYYSKGCDSREIFSGLKIAGLPTFEDKLNQNTVIFIDMQELRSIARGIIT